MRYCPTCRTQYTDDTLRFCLQDGATLVEQLASDTPTVAFTESETVARSAGAKTQDSQVTSWRGEEVTRVAASQPPKRTGLALPIIAGAAVLLFLFFAATIGIWLYVTRGRVVSTDEIAAGNKNANVSNFGNSSSYGATPYPSPSVGPTIIITPTPFVNNGSTLQPTPTAPPFPPDRPQQPVPQFINGWKSMAEARNLDAYMGNYADTVDYYRKSGASRGFVRADKARAFGMYNSMRVNISNLSFDVSADGRTATAVFDKEWDFRGGRNSSGKVQSQLKLRNENGRWLITGERDLRVYYTR